MDNTVATDLIELYDKWVTTVELQLAILRKNRTDESFDQLRMLEAVKHNTRLEILEYDASYYDQFNSSIRGRLTEIIETLLSLNDQAEPYLKAWYDEAAQDMKQVTTQQRVLTSYGGAQSSDIISLYVDSKK